MLLAPSSSSASVPSLPSSSTRAIPYGVAHIGNDTFLVIWSGKDVDTVSLCTSSFPPDARTISVPLNRKVHFDFGLPAHESTSPERDTNPVKKDFSPHDTPPSDLLSSPSSLAVWNASPHGKCYHRLYPSPDGRWVAVIAHALDGSAVPTSPPPEASPPHNDVLRSTCTHYMLLLTEVPFRVVEWQTPPYRVVRSVSWFVQKSGKRVEKKRPLAESSAASVTDNAAAEANTVSMSTLHSSSSPPPPPPPFDGPTRRLLLLLHTGELLSYDVSRHSLSVAFPSPSVVDLWKHIFRSTLSPAAVSSPSFPTHPTRHPSVDPSPQCRSASCGGRAPSPPRRNGSPLPPSGENTKKEEKEVGEGVRPPTPQGPHESRSSSHPSGSRGAAKHPSASSPSRHGSSPSSSSHLSPSSTTTTTTAPVAPHTVSRVRTTSDAVGKGGVLKKMNRFGVIVPDPNGLEKEAKKQAPPRDPPATSASSTKAAAAAPSRSRAPGERETAATPTPASPLATTTKTASGSGHREAAEEKKTAKSASPHSRADGGCPPPREEDDVKKHSPTPTHVLEKEKVVSQDDPKKEKKEEEEEAAANALLTHWFGDRLHLVVDMYMIPPTRSLPPVLLFLTRDGDVFAANVEKDTGLPASSSGSGGHEAATRVHHLIHSTRAQQATHPTERPEAAIEAERGMALGVRSILLDEDTGLHAILLAFADGDLTATLVDEPSLLARDRVVLADHGSHSAEGGGPPPSPSPKGKTDATSPPHFSPPLPSFLHRSTQQLVPLAPQWHIHLGREPSTRTTTSSSSSSSRWGNRIIQMEVVHHVCLMRFEDGAAYLVCLPRWNVSRGGWTYWYPFVGRGSTLLALGGLSSVVEDEGTSTGGTNAADLTPPPSGEKEEEANDDGNHTLSSTAVVALKEEYSKWPLIHSDASIVPDPIACRIPLAVSGMALAMGVREVLLSPLEIAPGVPPPTPPVANPPIVSVRVFSVEVAKLLRGAICASSAEWEWAWKAAPSPAEAKKAEKAAVAPSSALARTRVNAMERKEHLEDSLRQALQLLSKSYRGIFGGDSQEEVRATMTEEMRCLAKCVELQEMEEKAVAEREKNLWERVQMLQKDTSYASHTIDSWERTVLDATVHQRGSSVFSVANDRLGNVHDALNQMENLLHGVSTS